MVRLKLEMLCIGIFITSVAASEFPSQLADITVKSRSRRQARPFQIRNVSATFPDVPFIPFANQPPSQFRSSRQRVPTIRRLSRFSRQFSRSFRPRSRMMNQFPSSRNPPYQQPIVIRRIRLPSAIAALARRSQLRRQSISNRPLTSGRRAISSRSRQVSSRRLPSRMRQIPAIRRGAPSSQQVRRPTMRQFQHQGSGRLQQRRTLQRQQQQQQRQRQQRRQRQPTRRQQQRQPMNKRQRQQRQKQQQRRGQQQQKQQIPQKLKKLKKQPQNPQDPDIIAIFSLDGLTNQGVEMLPGLPLDGLFAGDHSMTPGIGAVTDPSLPGHGIGDKVPDLAMIDGVSVQGLSGPGKDVMYMLEQIPAAGQPPHFGSNTLSMDAMSTHHASKTTIFDKPLPVTDIHDPTLMKVGPHVEKIVPVTGTFTGSVESKGLKKVEPVVSKISAPALTQHDHGPKQIVPIVEKVVPGEKPSDLSHHDVGSSHPQSLSH